MQNFGKKNNGNGLSKQPEKMKYCIAYPYLGESREYRPKPYPPSALELLVKACKFFGYTVEELGVKSNKREIVRPRQMVMAAMRKSKKLGLKSIGDLLGGKDHTTVIHSKQKVQDMCDTDENYRRTYEKLTDYLNGMVHRNQKQ